MKITDKSVLAPKGFISAGVRAGIKKGKTNLLRRKRNVYVFEILKLR